MQAWEQPRREVEIAAASLRIEATGYGKCLDQRGFTGAILANEVSDLRMECELMKIANHGEHKREINRRYRAVFRAGTLSDDAEGVYIWIWIGSHSAFDKAFR